MRKSDGQALGEYSIGIALVAVALIAALIAVGGNISGMFTSIASGLQSQGSGEAKTSLGSTPEEISKGFIELILKYRDEHGRWPRSWEPYNYSDLGLDPDEWAGPIDGVKYIPAGDRFGIANALGDDYQIYVKSKSGRKLHVYDGYAVWYDFDSGQWYYHSKKDNIPVDIKTLEVVKKGGNSKPPEPIRVKPPEPLPPVKAKPPEPLPPVVAEPPHKVRPPVPIEPSHDMLPPEPPAPIEPPAPEPPSHSWFHGFHIRPPISIR